MNIHINGTLKTFKQGLTAAQLVDLLGLQDRRIAMEINQEILPRSRFESYCLKENDRVEIIHAVGGG